MKRKTKPYSQMSLSELRNATAEYDQEWKGKRLPGKPLTAADRKLHKRARGRPRVGEGAKIVPVSIERRLLREVDAFARNHQLNRSEMIARGLKLVLSTE